MPPPLSPSLPAPGAPAAAPRQSARALDQWRGLALILVLISHGVFYTGRVNGVGRVGVNLFFFISGLLVFRSLEKLRDEAPGARARAFLRHRLRRLYPAMAVYALVLLPVVAATQSLRDLPPTSDLAAYVRALPLIATFTANYIFDKPRALGHLWSVCCEMQFYLLAPLLYQLGGKASARRTVLWGLVLAVLLVLCYRGKNDDNLKYHFGVAVWPMMLGFFCEGHRRWAEWLPAAWAALVVRAGILVGGLGLWLLWHPGPEAKLLVVAVGLLLLPVCWLAYLHGREWPGRTGDALAWLGERTYSIYLWQQPLTICGYLPNGLHPLGALASVGVGWLSFRWLEKPFLSRNRRQALPELTHPPV